MKRINVMVTDSAKAVLIDHKETYKHSTLDETLDKILLGLIKEDKP